MSPLHPLRLPAFRRLAGAYAISRLGDTLALVALAIAIYDQTGSTVAVTALLLALDFIPALAAPAITARLDRIPTGRVLPWIYFLEGLLFCVLAQMTHNFALAPFLVLVAAEGALGVVARALARGAVAAVLEPTGELRAGNALLNMLIAPNMAAGGALGAVLVAGLGTDAALFANAATFGLGALVLATARGLPRYSRDGDEFDPAHWRARLREAFAYLRRNRRVLVLVMGQAAALVFFALTEPVEVAYTRDALDAGAGGFGALIAAWGAGVMVGSVVYAWVGARRLGPTTFVATVLLGASYLGLAAAPSIGVACAIAVLGGGANGAQLVAIGTAIQEAIPMSFQARVMSIYEALTTASPGVGYVVGGALGATVGGRAAFVVAGVGIFVVTAVVLVARRPRDGEPAPRSTPASPEPARERVSV